MSCAFIEVFGIPGLKFGKILVFIANEETSSYSGHCRDKLNKLVFEKAKCL